jgi:hypothetical protein
MPKWTWPKSNTHDTSRKVIILRMGWGSATNGVPPVTNIIAYVITTEFVLVIVSVSACGASMNGRMWDDARVCGTEFCTESVDVRGPTRVNHRGPPLVDAGPRQV